MTRTNDRAPFPAIIAAPAGTTDLASALAWVTANLSALNDQLQASGALLFRGFPVASAEAFDAFSAAFGDRPFTYRESMSNAVRINLTERVFTANEAPPEVAIHLHHEMAQTPVYPARLFFYCHAAAEAGGATPLCRSDWLYADLKTQAPDIAERFARLGLRYRMRMPAADDPGSGQGRSWMSTLGVTDRAAAEARLHQLGYSWTWGEDGSLQTVTPVLPAVRKLPDGSAAFFNQLIAAYLGWAGVHEDPTSALSFGDGTAIPRAALDLAVACAGQHTVDLLWQDGDVALVDNHRCMHGRHPYSGQRKRQVFVALGAD